MVNQKLDSSRGQKCLALAVGLSPPERESVTLRFEAEAVF